MNGNWRGARLKLRRKVAAYLIGCICLGALFIPGLAFAQFYCAKPLSTTAATALMAEAPLVAPPRPAVAALHRSATRGAEPRVGILSVFPRFIGGEPWPEMPIKYFVHSSANNRKQILALAIAEWEAKTIVRFKAVDEKEAKASPHFVVRGDDVGCYSWGLGYLKGGEAYINLSAGCSAGNAIHEIGHRLGLMHEHERSDRDRYIKIDWTQVERAVKAIKSLSDKKQKEKLENLGFLADMWEGLWNWVTTDHISEYDLVSIMQYPPNPSDIGKFFEPTEEGRRSLSTRFGANGTQAVNSIGQRVCITQWDADAINDRYKGVQ
jgi:hypothetical protein